MEVCDICGRQRKVASLCVVCDCRHVICIVIPCQKQSVACLLGVAWITDPGTSRQVCVCALVHLCKAQAGGLSTFQSDPEKLRAAVEFAAACGGFTCSKPGAISAQPTLEEAQALMKSAKAPV